MKRRLLFVTYNESNFDEGMSYALELAKAMSEDIVLLMVRRKERLAKKIEDLMTSVAFAEEGEHATAQQVVEENRALSAAELGPRVSELIVRSSKEGVNLEVLNEERDVIAGIRGFVKEHAVIDKVVLSPAITENEALTTRELSRLVRTASRPIVTMTRQSVQALKDISAQPAKPFLYEKEYA